MFDLDKISTGGLFASMIWGSIATGMLIYGWKQRAMVVLGGGVAITVVSCVLWNSAAWMSVASVAIVAAMIWLRKMGW